MFKRRKCQVKTQAKNQRCSEEGAVLCPEGPGKYSWREGFPQQDKLLLFPVLQKYWAYPSEVLVDSIGHCVFLFLVWLSMFHEWYILKWIDVFSGCHTFLSFYLLCFLPKTTSASRSDFSLAIKNRSFTCISKNPGKEKTKEVGISDTVESNWSRKSIF